MSKEPRNFTTVAELIEILKELPQGCRIFLRDLDMPESPYQILDTVEIETKRKMEAFGWRFGDPEDRNALVVVLW